MDANTLTPETGNQQPATKQPIVLPNQRWEHIHQPGLIAEIQRPDQLSSYQWICSLFLGNKYLNLVTINTMTLLKYYKKLDV